MNATIEETILSRIIKDISETRMLSHKAVNLNLPDDLVDKVYSTINWDEVINSCIGDIQNRICDVIVQSMITEIKTDTKAVLQIRGVREKLRVEAYPKIMEALNGDQ